MRIQYLLPILLLSACSDGKSSPQPTHDPTIASDPAALPQKLRDRALLHIAMHFPDGRIGRIVPIYRPDVAGAAYYAVEVMRGKASIGSIYLSTGPHDAPIPKWSEEPGLLVDDLADAARAR